MFAQAPTLTRVSPSASNNTRGQVALDLIGTNLATTTQATFTGPVTVNVTSSDIALVSGTNIVVVTPVNLMPAGNYTVRVTAAGGPSNTLPFTVTNAAPEVDSVTPSAGGNIANQAVVLAGRNFAGVTRVDFVGPVTRNLAFTVNSTTQITATVPSALPAGTYRLQVQASTGPSNDDVTFRVDDARTASTAQITDQFGNPRTSISLGSDRLFVSVTDRDKDTDSASQQSVTVTVTDGQNQSTVKTFQWTATETSDSFTLTATNPTKVETRLLNVDVVAANKINFKLTAKQTPQGVQLTIHEDVVAPRAKSEAAKLLGIVVASADLIDVTLPPPAGSQ